MLRKLWAHRELVLAAILLIVIVLSGTLLYREHYGKNAFSVQSEAIRDRAPLPAEYTCDGAGIIPPFKVENVPEGTLSWALLLEDLDQTKEEKQSENNALWMMFNIPPSFTEIKKGIRPPGTITRSLGGKNEYYPPCPPPGEERKYQLTIFALNKELLPINYLATRAEFEAELEGRVLRTTRIPFTYNGSISRESEELPGSQQ
jgi:Raf kinase inhibitor-like YbhB/YbcL family protein